MSAAEAPAWRQYETQIAEMLDAFDDVIVSDFDSHRIGKLSGTRRQVDVWVEGHVAGGMTVTVAVECKLRRGTIGIGDVDEFHGKLADLGADKGIMYSKSEFTGPAVARAAGQDQPTIALINRDLEVDYERLLGPDCPNENCYLGTVGWNAASVTHVPDDSSLFQAGDCDTCGTLAVRCGNCGSTNAFFSDFVQCDGCEAAWKAISDRDGVDQVIQVRDGDGAAI